MKTTLSKLVRMPLREAWKHEAGDFTPWMKALDRGALMSVVSSAGRLESFGRQWPVFARFGPDLHNS